MKFTRQETPKGKKRTTLQEDAKVVLMIAIVILLAVGMVCGVLDQESVKDILAR
jgi:Mg2+/citrate symporter